MHKITAAIAALLIGSGLHAVAEEPFDRELAARQIDASFFEAPKTFAPGDFKVSVSLANLGDAALRGTLEVELPDANDGKGRTLASAELDLPPNSVSSVPEDLVAKGKLTRKDVGHKVRVVLKTKGHVTVLREGVVQPKADAAKAAASPDAGTARGGVRHEFRYLASFDAAAGEQNGAFIEDGGVVLVGNVRGPADFAGAAAFVDGKEMPKFKAQTGRANAYDANVGTGRNPWCDWPNALSPLMPLGDNRLELPGAANRRWETLQQRGQPVTVLLRYGQGALVLSTHDIGAQEFRRPLEENFLRQFALGELGLRYVQGKSEYRQAEEFMGFVGHPTVYGGTTSLKLACTDLCATNLSLALRLTLKDAKGQSRTFLERGRRLKKVGENSDLKIETRTIDLSGECSVTTELLDFETGKVLCSSVSKTVLDAPFAVVPPDFRATVSTVRQESDVLIGLRLVKAFGGVNPAKWTLKATDAKGISVASCEGLLAPGARFAEARLPLAKDAPAGDYALEAEISDGVTAFSATGAFKVVAPERGQVMVDQNGFYLRNGEPYFPLGVYHCHTFNWQTPIDKTGLRAMDMGFNWMQMWQWDWENHLSLDRETLGRYVKKSLGAAEREAAIDDLVATNRHLRTLMKDVTICFEGFGIWENCIVEHPGEDGKYSFERLENLERDVRKISEDPDQLVGMWYLADEAGGNFYNALGRATALLKKYDPKLHPTFNLGNLPATMSGDAGGNDIYVRYYGGVGSARTFADRIDALVRDYAPFHRRPLIVPQAFGQSPQQSTETPEWVRIEAYLSVIHGANGIGFYCWQQTGDWKGNARQGMSWNPPTAHEVQKLIAEIKTFQFALRDPGRRFLVSDDGNVDACLCGDAKSERFLICANVYEGAVDTVLPVPGADVSRLEPLFGAPAPKKAPAGLALKLPSWGTAVYLVK